VKEGKVEEHNATIREETAAGGKTLALNIKQAFKLFDFIVINYCDFGIIV
jgi:hypothetical protein